MNQIPKQEPQGNLLYKQISTTYHTTNSHYVFHIGYLMILVNLFRYWIFKGAICTNLHVFIANI